MMGDLISRSALIERIRDYADEVGCVRGEYELANGILKAISVVEDAPTVDAVPVVHGEYILEAHNEEVNYRWNVTAECSECGLSKGEIWAGYFPYVPNSLAEEAAIASAERVKISNFCPNCGAKMDGKKV